MDSENKLAELCFPLQKSNCLNQHFVFVIRRGWWNGSNDFTGGIVGSSPGIKCVSVTTCRW